MYKNLSNDLKRRRRTPRCPHPNCPSNHEPWDLDPWEAQQCTLNKPLYMVIPPEGVHLSCPVHPEGHHIYGSSVTWMETPVRYESNLPDRQNMIGSGSTENDTFKFSM